jgi:hypothetical protein
VTWLSSLFISLLTGGLGLLCGGFIMNLCVGWYRVSSFEGKSGYAVVSVAFLGGIAGFALGLIVSRIIAAGADPGFLKGLGYATGATLAIALVALGLCRLGADLAPEIDGQSLELVIEIRCPESFTLPATTDEYGATAEVYLPGGQRQPSGNLRLAEATRIDGHWVVPATLPLTTRSSSKYLNARFSKETSLIFSLPLRSNPKSSDMEWSNWVDSAWDAGQPEPAKEAKFNLRYRVQLHQAPPPEPDPAAEEADRFAALDPGEPLEQWLEFASPAGPMERNNAIADIVAQRQDELATLVLSTDPELREKAMLMSQYLATPTPAVGDALLAEGRAIAEEIRKSNVMQDDDPGLVQILFDLSTRFNSWKRAYWVVTQRLGQDGRPIYREIHELASVRPPGTKMDEIKLNARVILDELDKQ